ncbi:MAG: hypothetical protein AAF608_07370 [Pseudomonadota bacterium]
MTKTFTSFVSAVIFLLSPSDAQTVDLGASRVTVIEPSYLPSWASFQVANMPPGCGWLSMHPDPADPIDVQVAYTHGIYATLMTAMMGDATVQLFSNDGDDCTIENIHLVAP